MLHYNVRYSFFMIERYLVAILAILKIFWRIWQKYTSGKSLTTSGTYFTTLHRSHRITSELVWELWCCLVMSSCHVGLSWRDGQFNFGGGVGEVKIIIQSVLGLVLTISGQLSSCPCLYWNKICCIPGLYKCYFLTPLFHSVSAHSKSTMPA